MNFRFPVRPAATSIAMCGVALALSAVLFPAQAGEWDKRTVLTVNQPIQVENTFLEPGTYVFKLNTLSADRHIVQIFNADESHIINTILAIPNYRLQPTGNSRFAFWETPPGTAKALRAWFYPGDNFGQEFLYPKHLRQLASLITNEAPPAPAPPAEAPEPAPAPAPVAEAASPAPAPPETPAEPAPAPAPEPQATPAPAPASEPEQLPKTATSYPAIGLAGLFSLALYGLLRRKDPAKG